MLFAWWLFSFGLLKKVKVLFTFYFLVGEILKFFLRGSTNTKVGNSRALYICKKLTKKKSMGLHFHIGLMAGFTWVVPCVHEYSWASSSGLFLGTNGTREQRESDSFVTTSSGL